MTTPLKLLRDWMVKHDLDAFILPGDDPHFSEYVAPHWACRKWLTGFTGSAGTAVVTADHAGLWTDSRYFLQAEKELPRLGFELHRQKVPHAPEHLEWVLGQLPDGAKVGWTDQLIGVTQAEEISGMFSQANITLVLVSDPFQEIWQDRPALPQDPIFELALKHSGQARREKLQQLKKKVDESGASHLLLTALDEIAWTLNLRGEDVKYNPVFHAYLIIGPETSELFIDLPKVPEAVIRSLLNDGVELRHYHAVNEVLSELQSSDVLMIDPGRTSQALLQQVQSGVQVIRQTSPVTLAKALRNSVEVENLRQAMIKDGVALTALFRWLENTDQIVKEYDLAKKLDQFRKEQGNFFGPSFGTIAGFAGNGAIIHYQPHTRKSAVIGEGMLLLDSGGQYLEGTTDITRTICLGEPTAEQKTHYTLVLQGHIRLSQAIFPRGTSGDQLDMLARQALWNEGLNYGHGTGHGVGHFLNVHEGPQAFGTGATAKGGSPLMPGMIITIEPGFYLEDQYGIRIENIVLVKEKPDDPSGNFLCFEPLTVFPIDQNLIDFDRLTSSELNWLNNYHQFVEETLTPHLDEAGAEWLRDQIHVRV